MQFCSECGFKVENNQNKCLNCGNKLKKPLFDKLGKNTLNFADNLKR